MDANIKQAVDDVRKLTRYFESLNSLCAALDGVASVEQAAHEAEQRIVSAKADEDAALQALDNARRATADEHARAQIISENCDKLIDEAKRRADEVIAKARADADAVVLALDAKRAAAASEIDDARQALAGVRSEIEAASAELAAMQDKLAQAREAARQLIGA